MLHLALTGFFQLSPSVLDLSHLFLYPGRCVGDGVRYPHLQSQHHVLKRGWAVAECKIMRK